MSSKKHKKDSMDTIDQVVKYINQKNSMNNINNCINPWNLITSEGLPIQRGRMHSTTNASTSSHSTSKPRKRFHYLSNSIERNPLKINQRSTSQNVNHNENSTILIQNFLVSINEASVQKGRKQTSDSLGSNLPNAKCQDMVYKSESAMSAPRKSHNQSHFPKTSSMDNRGKLQISNYKEMRNLRLQEKSITKSERSLGKWIAPILWINCLENEKSIINKVRSSNKHNSEKILNYNSSYNLKQKKHLYGTSEFSEKFEERLRMTNKTLNETVQTKNLKNALEIEKIQKSMKQRLANVLSRQSNLSTPVKTQAMNYSKLHSKLKPENKQLNWVSKQLAPHTQEEDQPDDEYTKVPNRKHFRIDGEKASRSINHQSSIIKPLLEVIEEVNQEDYKVCEIEQVADTTVDESWVIVDKKMLFKSSPNGKLSSEIPQSKKKLNKFLNPKKSNKVQVVEVFLGNSLLMSPTGPRSNDSSVVHKSQIEKRPNHYSKRSNSQQENSKYISSQLKLKYMTIGIPKVQPNTVSRTNRVLAK